MAFANATDPSATANSLNILMTAGTPSNGSAPSCGPRAGKTEKLASFSRADFGAFIKRFEVLPLPQPLAALQPVAGLVFAVKDVFGVWQMALARVASTWAYAHLGRRRRKGWKYGGGGHACGGEVRPATLVEDDSSLSM